jgi:hypothetical protein
MGGDHCGSISRGHAPTVSARSRAPALRRGRGRAIPRLQHRRSVPELLIPQRRIGVRRRRGTGPVRALVDGTYTGWLSRAGASAAFHAGPRRDGDGLSRRARPRTSEAADDGAYGAAKAACGDGRRPRAGSALPQAPVGTRPARVLTSPRHWRRCVAGTGRPPSRASSMVAPHRRKWGLRARPALFPAFRPR